MDYSTPKEQTIIDTTITALTAHNFQAEFVPTKEAALARIKELIPGGASVMTGSSITLNQIGFTAYLKSGAHPWNNLKAAIVAEKDSAKQTVLRKQAVLADYWLGSVHAVTESGEILTASASGSQLPAYAYTSPNVIWAVGTQKIVPNLEEAFKRLREYTFPREDARMKTDTQGKSGSSIAKVLINYVEPTYSGRTLRIIFIGENLGF